MNFNVMKFGIMRLCSYSNFSVSPIIYYAILFWPQGYDGAKSEQTFFIIIEYLRKYSFF